ncbi:hypothetical protein D3C73_663400 [compost metagenome]
MRQRAVFQQELGLAAIGGKDAVADETFGDTGHDRQFFQPFCNSEAGGENIRRGLLATDDFEQAHDMRRREEMQAEHPPWMPGCSGDLVRVQVARIGGKDCVRADHLVEAAEEVDLDVEVVEHGFDHEIAGGKVGIRCGD